MTALDYLFTELKNIVPTCEGLSIGKWEDKSTWRVDAKDYTPEQKTAFNKIVEAFNKEQFDAAQPVVLSVEDRLAALEQRLTLLEMGML
jgi:hypothetical protein